MFRCQPVQTRCCATSAASGRIRLLQAADSETVRALHAGVRMAVAAGLRPAAHQPASLLRQLPSRRQVHLQPAESRSRV